MMTPCPTCCGLGYGVTETPPERQAKRSDGLVANPLTTCVCDECRGRGWVGRPDHRQAWCEPLGQSLVHPHDVDLRNMAVLVPEPESRFTRAQSRHLFKRNNQTT